MTDTTPAALRALADDLYVPAFDDLDRAAATLRALAAEKEEKGWYKPTVDVDTHARQLIGGSFDWPSVHMGGPSPRAMERAESLWDALKEEILPRVLTPAARDARRAALEEAAKVAEDLRHPNWSSETEDWVAGTVAVAAAIRALIDREPAPVKPVVWRYRSSPERMWDYAEGAHPPRGVGAEIVEPLYAAAPTPPEPTP